MCRTGGRRCPAYSDPVKTAERNARRRAAYGKSKGKTSSKVKEDNSSSFSNVKEESNVTTYNTGNEFLDSVINGEVEAEAKEAETNKAEDEAVAKLLDMEEDLFGPAPKQAESSESSKKVAKTVKPKKKVTVKKPLGKYTKSTKPTSSIKEDLGSIAEETEKEQKLKEFFENKKKVAEKETEESFAAPVGSPLIAAPFEYNPPAGKGKVKKLFKQAKVELHKDPSNWDSEKKGHSAAALFSTHDKEDYNDNLNLTVKYNSGSLVEKGYFNDKTLAGVLDYTKLAETDDRDLGFEQIPTDGESYEIYEKDDLLSPEDFAALSEAEIGKLSDDERKALTYFTSHQYEWVNNALFQKKVRKGKVEKGSTDTFDAVLEGSQVYDGKNSVNLKRITSEIDKALAKGPKQQRILYRGIKPDAAFLKDDEGNQISASQWVDNNLTVGNEIKFDGYQSASPRAKGVGNYTKSDGVFYEIMTPEGVNVESITDYSGEFEVTLPRDSRYTVASITKNASIKTFDSDFGRKKNMTIVRLVAINSKGEVLDGTNSDKVKPITDSYFDKMVDADGIKLPKGV